MSWYIEVLKKYAVFSGRARRKEYWFFFLFNIIVLFMLAIIDGIAGTFSAVAGMGILSGIYYLAVLIPGVAVSVRRLHDNDKSAWSLLLALIPFLGGIILLIFMASEGNRGDNRYGPSPIYGESLEAA